MQKLEWNSILSFLIQSCQDILVRMTITKTYFPEVNLELKSRYNDKKSLTSVYTTRREEKGVRSSISNTKFVMAHQIGQDELHTATYINEKGERFYVKFDASRPCKFNTNETRFYKPKLHTFGY